MHFNRLNNLGAWVAFAIAFGAYLFTLEPTSSLWDCGEFISSAYKVQIPHPPGAPLFVLVGRLFIILFGDDPATAAKAVNVMSALVSAFSILFLFWTITWFAKRIVKKDSWLVIIAGFTGSLAYAFSDSFWFSAVEGEVYALSSFFTAIVFWSILKWERRADTRAADKWLVFIFFMIGLSIGVHLLNLLSIPAIVMVYYFRKYKPTTRGTVIAFISSCLITGFIQKFIIQYTVKGAAGMDVYFVNDLGLPFFSGFAMFFILIATILYFLLRYSVRKKYRLLNIGVWSTFFILIGYSTYITTMIRSNADTAIDMFNVDNPVSLGGYLGREQYGDWPILYGPDFNDRPPFKPTGDLYVKGDGRYEVAGKVTVQEWANTPSSHFFPRMWDNSNDRQQQLCYQRFSGIEEGESPTMADNMKYFVNYQAGWMYMRYFLWNFAGKQNDLQGFGNPRDSNWISGIPFIDNVKYGDQSQIPESIRTSNKAYNRLFMLPLILGLAGIFIQYKKQSRDLLVNSLFFLLTGMAIVVYLNQAGFQPRERDYAYVGSFYAFAIWIGLGVLLVHNIIAKFIKGPRAVWAAGLICIISVPLWMAHEEWDDHDRSGKTLARDMARNYLESCPPNAILFTYEDNDTYPLWYAQEVEGIRPDVRVIVNTLAGSDWYMNQLRYKVNESEPYDLIFSKQQIQGDNRQVTYFAAMPGFDQQQYYDLRSAFKNVLANDNPQFVTTSDEGITYNLTPIRKFTMPVNRAGVINSGIAGPDQNIASEIKIDLSNKNYLLRSDLLILALIASGNWDRPICFTSVTGPQDLNLDKYLRHEGFIYRLVPFERNGTDAPIDTEIAYDILMNKANFGTAGNGIYYDEENRRRLNIFRLNYAQVAIQLANDNQKEKARKLLRRFDAAFSRNNFPYGMTSNRGNQHNGIAAQFLYACHLADENELVKKITPALKKDLTQQVQYYNALGDELLNADELAQNAYQQLQTGIPMLSLKQAEFAGDILSSYQLLRQIDEWEKKL